METILECTYGLIEEIKVYHQGKIKQLDAKLKKRIVGKQAGKIWDSEAGRYRNQTGAEKISFKRRSIKRNRTMKTGKAARARASRIGDRERAKLKKRYGID